MDSIYNFFSPLPEELAVFFMAMFPLTELRLAVPFAIGVLKMPVILSFLLSVLGNLVPAVLLVWFLPKLAVWLSHHSVYAERFFSWWFGRVIKKFSDSYQRYGEWGLMIFVAIPLPFTGAWTGAAAAFLFNIPPRRGLIFVSLGVVLAGIIVTLLSAGVFHLF